jgi:hypothetical protein
VFQTTEIQFLKLAARLCNIPQSFIRDFGHPIEEQRGDFWTVLLDPVAGEVGQLGTSIYIEMRQVREEFQNLVQ